MSTRRPSTRGLTRLVGAAALASLLALGSCSSDAPGAGSEPTATTTSSAARDHAVGTTTMTFVDASRPTPTHGTEPGAPDRTLETTILYPAEGTPDEAPSPEATPDAANGPFPLVVFSHGLGGNVEYLTPLATSWAAAGYVVAMPHFPLTYVDTPGGPAGEDVQNQPGDVSFVIDQLVAKSDTADSLLSGTVDADAIAAAGHSNGAITTLGLTAHECCRDERIDAAIVLAGTPGPFVGGEYDFSGTPPMLFVHGVEDALLSYDAAAEMFNQIEPPKGFLTVEQGDHGSYFSPNDPAFPDVERATLDFLDGELRGDTAALARLPQDQTPGVSTMAWAPDAASDVTVSTLAPVQTDRAATISVQDGLQDGQTVTITWSGFIPGKVVNVVQCAGDGTGGSAECNISGGKILQDDPTGEGRLELVVHTGAIGTGTCDAANPCTVVVNDAGLTDEAATIRFPVTFAP